MEAFRKNNTLFVASADVCWDNLEVTTKTVTTKTTLCEGYMWPHAHTLPTTTIYTYIKGMQMNCFQQQ